MLFAAWRRADDPSTESRWATIRSFVRGSGASSAETDEAIVAGGPPSRFERTAAGGVVWLHRGRPGVEPLGPEVRLEERQLTVTCGPLPQFTLYYHRSRDDSLLLVCSHLKPLVELVPSGKVNLTRVAQIIAWQWGTDPSATAFENLHRVVACETIVAAPGGIQVTRRVPRAGYSYLRLGPRELAEALHAHIDAAVGRAIGDAQRVAVFAGGGLDSSGLLALAVARSRGATERDVRAIAAVWTSPGGDDRPHLAALERELGIVAMRCPAGTAGQWLVPSLCADAQPQPAPAACIDMLLWSAAAKAGAQISLAGHAGDDVLGGIISFERLSRRHPVESVRRALALKVPARLSPARRMAAWILVPALRSRVPGLVRSAQQHRYRRAWMTQRTRMALRACLRSLPMHAPATPDEWLEHYCTQPSWAELAASWSQIASAVPIEVVDVYRDLDLVRFVAQIDPLDLSDGDMFRGLYRRAMKGVLPETIRLRQDKSRGMDAVADAIAAADAEGELSDLASLSALARAHLARPAAFARQFAHWSRQTARDASSRGEHQMWFETWQVLSAERFLREYAGHLAGEELR
jgi:asparagine synthetase B (glutamine-hydrolysing)